MRIKEKTKNEENDYAKLLLDELRREDKLFTSRFNLFLIAESLLFLSYATLIVHENINKSIIVIIGLLAFLITIVYSIILRRTKSRIGEIRDELRIANSNYKRFEDMRISKGNVHLLLWRLTLLFFFAWVGLLFYSI
jgi:hypothetical protein